MRISDWSSDVCSSDLRALMIRSELVQMLADENPDLALRDVEAIVSTFFDEITARLADDGRVELRGRSEEHTSELQSLMRISYAVFCLKKKKEKQSRQIGRTADN